MMDEHTTEETVEISVEAAETALRELETLIEHTGHPDCPYAEPHPDLNNDPLTDDNFRAVDELRDVLGIEDGG